MEKKRIITWDVTKGFGMLLVILGHLVSEDTYLKNFIYSFHMPLFFIISGFVLKCDNKNLIEIIKSEKKMIVTYLFWSVIYFATDLVIRFGVLRIITRRGIIERIIYVFSTYGINVLWFIGTLMIGRIMAKEFLLLFADKKRRWIVTLIFIVLPAGFSPVLELINSWFISVILVVIMRGAFALGFLLFGHLTKDKMAKFIGGGIPYTEYYFF